MSTRFTTLTSRIPAASILSDGTKPNAGCAVEPKKPRKDWKTAIAIVFAAGILGGCANMAPRQQNAAIGAAVGGVAGAILTDGSGIGTAGGAAVGGYIGDQVNR